MTGKQLLFLAIIAIVILFDALFIADVIKLDNCTRNYTVAGSLIALFAMWFIDREFVRGVVTLTDDAEKDRLKLLELHNKKTASSAEKALRLQRRSKRSAELAARRARNFGRGVAAEEDQGTSGKSS